MVASPAGSSRAEGSRSNELEMNDVLAVEDVEIRYGAGEAAFTAVAGIDLQIPEHRTTVIIGPSGCGKSTLLLGMAGFILPTKGRFAMDGEAIRGPSPERMVVFQDFEQLFPWFSVQRNLEYALKVTRGLDRQRAVTVARESLAMVGMLAAAHKHPHELSGGMKQRTAIARALSLESRILLMDEPFGALDAITRSQLQVELKAIVTRTKVTVVFITHSISEAIFLGDQVVCMAANPGRVVDTMDVAAIHELSGPQFDAASDRLRGSLQAGTSQEHKE